MLFLTAYIINKQDLLAPSVLCCMMYVVCIMFAILNIKNWGIDYSEKTFLIMAIAMISFIIPSIFFNIKNDNANDKYYNNIEVLTVDNKILTVCLVVDIIISIYYFKEVYRISLIGGNNMGYAGMFTYYRIYTATNADAEGMSTLANQFLKLGRSFGFVSVFIWMYNTQISPNLKRDKLLIPFVILTALQNVIGGGRGYILWLVSTGFTSAYIINMKKYNWKKRISFKYIKTGAVVLIIIFIVFYLLKYIVRVGNTVDSMLDYIGYYAGGSIQNFNLYMLNPPSNTHQIWGQESFTGLYSTLQKFGLVDVSSVYLTNTNLEFRMSNGVSIGNVYGAVRRYYNDFGLVGVIILQLTCSIFYNAFYHKIKKAHSNESKFQYLFYAYLVYHIYEMPIDDTFFKNFISFNMLTTFIVLYMVYYLFTNVQIVGTKIYYHRKNRK